MDRRTFITASAVAPLAGVASAETPKPSAADQIDTAIQALMSALQENVPDGFKLHQMVSVINGRLFASAFPEGYQKGQAYVKYDHGLKDWQMAT